MDLHTRFTLLCLFTSARVLSVPARRLPTIELTDIHNIVDVAFDNLINFDGLFDSLLKRNKRQSNSFSEDENELLRIMNDCITYAKNECSTKPNNCKSKTLATYGLKMNTIIQKIKSSGGISSGFIDAFKKIYFETKMVLDTAVKAQAQTDTTTTFTAPTTTPQITNTPTEDCYQNYTLSNREGQIMSSPGFIKKQNYPNNVKCTWTFTAPPGEKVSMTILQMDTEYGYDVIRVMDGIGEEDNKLPILSTMSGQEIPDGVISRASQMTVTFSSDINFNMTGFQANIVAFKKADLPEFTWIDLFTLNIKYPNGENETIPLSLGTDVDTSCIFIGQNLETSVIITSPSSTKECKSLDQQIEIMLVSSHLQNIKYIYTLKNGKLKEIQENNFENNEVARKRNMEKLKLPKKIRIPIQFAFEKGLEEKFSKYEQDKSYIKKRITEMYYASKYSLQNILNDTNVEFILEKNIMFINEVLELNQSTLIGLRKYQIREDIPLIVLCAEDYNNNIKGLSFRSGACRKDKSHFGTIMLTWRDDGGLAEDVLEHELAHLIGGVHNQKNGTETYVGHTDFNSDNINAWYTLAGHRCYGKNCSPPPAMLNGNWTCDSELQSCYLKCDRGFTNMSSAVIECQNGKWPENINLGVCSPFVYLVAEQDVEIFHPDVQNLTCHNKPPALGWSDRWTDHTTFSDQHNLYLCGGRHTPRSCRSYNYITKTWSTHSLSEERYQGHSSVIVAGSVFLVGGSSALRFNMNNDNYAGVLKTQLPMEAIAPTWTQVTNIKYEGVGQCALTSVPHNLVITGGYYRDYYYNAVLLSNVTYSYNVVEGTTQELAPLMQPRGDHGCIILEEDGSMWIVVTGGQYYDKHWIKLKSTERINLSEKGSKWESSGHLNVPRSDHKMALTLHGPMVVGGWNNKFKSIEVLNFGDRSWKLLQASLSRWTYGGIVELPAYLFNCELDVKTGCPDLPTKENSNWICDSTNTTCMLICHPGFSSYYTTTTCEAGIWKDINSMECTESVFVLAGGEGAERNVELYTSDIEKIACNNPPSSLDQDWDSHTTFTHHGTLYLCGGVSCVSNSHNKWREHLLPQNRGFGLSAVVFTNSLFLVGGHSLSGSSEGRFLQVGHTVLPILGKSQQWTTVPDLYEGENQCVLKIGIHLMVFIGGDLTYFNWYAYLYGSRVVTTYNVLKGTRKELDQLTQYRSRHGCILIQENGSSSILVTGGYHQGGLKSTEILDLSNEGNNWVSTSDMDLAVNRYGHSMILTKKGALVIGGQSETYTLLKSIEIFNLTTQSWIEYGQSLATPRSMFGGIMELPAVLFGCQTRPIDITGCTEEYKYNQEFTGGDPAPVSQNETCHSVCQQDDNCLAWTWTSTQNDEMECRIIKQQSSLQSNQSKPGSILGLKNSCKPKCYLILYGGEEASTNTQFCTNENTDTDCLDMIHMEPDDFQQSDDGKIKMCHEEEGGSFCEDVKYEDVDLFCNPDPGIVTLSTMQRINKHFFTRNLGPSFGKWGRK